MLAKCIVPAAAAAFLCLPVAACETAVSPTPSWFMASVSGSDSAFTYEGFGTWHRGQFPDGAKLFQLATQGTGEFSGFAFYIHNDSGVRPGRGRHEVTLAGVGVVQEVLFFSDDFREWFIAESGHVSITESTRARLAGEFEVEVFHYCSRDDNPVGCPPPAQAPADAERRRIVGSFSLLRSDLVDAVYITD